MRHLTSATSALALVLWVGIVTPIPLQNAQAQATGPCGTFYRIQRGDTLRALALSAYGHDRYRVIFNANRDILRNPAEIETGQLIYLPCEGRGAQRRIDALTRAGRVPTEVDQLGTRLAGRRALPEPQPEPEPAQERVAVVDAAGANSLPKRSGRALRTGVTAEGAETAPVAARPQATEQAAPATRGTRTGAEPAAAVAAIPAGGAIRMLTADGMAPLAGRGLPQDGLVGALIRQALQAAVPALQVETAFVNDRLAHLDVLLPLDAFALSYPWPKPDCSGAAAALPHSSRICRAFAFSLPIYQTEIRFLARQGASVLNVQSPGGLRGNTICRPEAFPPVDLERDAPAAKIVLGRDVAACVEALATGRADMISAPASMIAAIGPDAGLVELTALRRQEPVHAIFSGADRQAAGLREQLDRGLRTLQSSGAWFSTVSRYLADYNRKRLAVRN